MTYSIVARCPRTGQLGVGVQSHSFACGAKVPWARAGVGVVATQSVTNVSFGPRGLDLMASGMAPQDALDTLLASDEQSAGRQVALLDAQGRVAVHTGHQCIEYAGHLVGEGVVFQANLMAEDGVLEAMAHSWSATTEQSLEERLLAALHAAEQAGGDLRGQQAAALLVVASSGANELSAGVIVDLRVDDNTQPLRELSRLLKDSQGYRLGISAETLMLQGKTAEASRIFEQARKMIPHRSEIPFWQAISLKKAGQHEAADEAMRDATPRSAKWEEFLRRVVPFTDSSSASDLEELINDKEL